MTAPDSDDPFEPTAPEKVSCRVCGRELPADLALSAEAKDYVVWFCGLECYTAWKRDRRGQEQA